MVNKDFDARNKIKIFLFEMNSFSSYPENHRAMLPEDISRDLGKNTHTTKVILYREVRKGNITKEKFPRPTFTLYPWERHKGRKRVGFKLTRKSINYYSKNLVTGADGRLYVQLHRKVFTVKEIKSYLRSIGVRI